jgi:hypothetical protein
MPTPPRSLRIRLAAEDRNGSKPAVPVMSGTGQLLLQHRKSKTGYIAACPVSIAAPLWRLGVCRYPKHRSDSDTKVPGDATNTGALQARPADGTAQRSPVVRTGITFISISDRVLMGLHSRHRLSA